MRSIYFLIIAIGAALVGAITGSIVTALTFSIQVRDSSSATLSFNDFAGILLSCVALIMTGFGVILAVLGVYGFAAIQENAKQTAEKEAKLVVNRSINKGGVLHTLVEKTVISVAFSGVGLRESSGAADPREE